MDGALHGNDHFLRQIPKENQLQSGANSAGFLNPNELLLPFAKRLIVLCFISGTRKTKIMSPAFAPVFLPIVLNPLDRRIYLLMIYRFHLHYIYINHSDAPT
jgi:hypothetical protein